MTVVFDTSVLFSAFAFRRGLCGDIFRACLGRFELAMSEHILDELRRHLHGKTYLLPADVDEVLAILRAAGRIVVPAAVPPGACRDPDDLPVLGTAVPPLLTCLSQVTKTCSYWLPTSV